MKERKREAAKGLIETKILLVYIMHVMELIPLYLIDYNTQTHHHRSFHNLTIFLNTALGENDGPILAN
jgi:hypothetical protein